MVIKTQKGRVIGVLRVGCYCFAGSIFKCTDARIQIFDGDTD